MKDRQLITTEETGKTISKNVEEELEEEQENEKEIQEVTEKKSLRIFVWLAVALIFIGALSARVHSLFFFTNPQNAGLSWYPDTYHHWQIAYLTKEIGLSHGLTRLWDLKGMEYFWGIGQPYILVVLFFITRSADILIPRLLDVVLGSASVVLIFLIAKRYFNFQAAAAAAILAAFNPVGIFNDASGMQEPVGIFLLLAGIYFWPRKPVLTGILFALASTVRAEYWVFTAGLIGAVFFVEKGLERKIQLAFAWIIPIAIYMKILLDRTGNPIYPIYWNFFGNAAGRWQADIPLTTEQISVRVIFGIILAVSLIGILLTLWKRPKWYLLALLGFGNFAFLAVFVGFTEFLKSYLPRFWLDRIFLLPYMFAGFLLAALLLWWLPKKTHWILNYPAFLVVLVVLVVSQLAWKPIWDYYSPSLVMWEREEKIASQIAESYEGGTLVIPEDRPQLTYMLYKYHGIAGRNIQGQMYDPFAYMQGDPFKEWSKNREIIFNWVKQYNIKLIATYKDRERYIKLAQREPNKFKLVSGQNDILVYKVEVNK